jgi:hypothetical protein
MKIKIPSREAFADEDLLGHVLAGPTFKPQRTLLMAAFGEKLTKRERVIFEKFTGRPKEPGKMVSEFCIVAGRRTGKTVMDSAAATYLASCCDYSDVLIRGETGVLLCLAQDQRIAGKILDFCEENLKQSKILQQLLIRRTQDTIELKNNIRIEVRPASYRKLRGPTYIGIIADELAFWYTEDGYQNPDVEVLAAARQTWFVDDAWPDPDGQFAIFQKRRAVGHVQAALRSQWFASGAGCQGQDDRSQSDDLHGRDPARDRA